MEHSDAIRPMAVIRGHAPLDDEDSDQNRD